MVIANFFGAPGAGKSTLAAYTFSKLKMMDVNAELVTEFAKDKTWEHNNSALSNQLYMAGKQYYRLTRCGDQVDVIVTDSPLLLNCIYHTGDLGEYFDKLIIDIFKKQNSLNFFINRVKKYNPKGRNQTEEESDELSIKIKNLLLENKIPFMELPGNVESADMIVNLVKNKLEKD